ncbi:MAG: hypothetical protein NUW37_10065 [Planctomycetes bacterium]|nr:hypothetical protein [Planctomycetota bacterium]
MRRKTTTRAHPAEDLNYFEYLHEQEAETPQALDFEDRNHNGNDLTKVQTQLGEILDYMRREIGGLGIALCRIEDQVKNLGERINKIESNGTRGSRE